MGVHHLLLAAQVTFISPKKNFKYFPHPCINAVLFIAVFSLLSSVVVIPWRPIITKIKIIIIIMAAPKILPGEGYWRLWVGVRMSMIRFVRIAARPDLGCGTLSDPAARKHNWGIWLARRIYLNCWNTIKSDVECRHEIVTIYSVYVIMLRQWCELARF